MSAVAPPPIPPPLPPETEPKPSYDPDAYRMTIGEHLEELRTRLILAGIGFVIAAFACFALGNRVVGVFCRPLIQVLQQKHLNPQLFYTEVSDGFMVVFRISLICAAAVSAPWVAYQIWQFVAAGLYPHERKYVTRYMPLSIALMIGGMVFVYFVVLPWTIDFFISFGDAIPLQGTTAHLVASNVPPAGLLPVPLLNGDPPKPKPGDLWFNQPEGRLKIMVDPKNVMVVPFGSDNLLAPHIELPEYIDLVVGTLLTFGLCFQLPLVVLAIVRLNIVDIATFRKSRRYVYFGISVLAATMTPGDAITAMVALMLPLILLFEFGIFLAVWNTPKSVE